MIISFDLDGTLVDRNFDELLWYETIPGLYAKKHSVSVSQARDICSKAYDNLGDKDIRWYSIRHWFQEFQLEEDWKKVIQELKEKINLYPETLEVLRKLSKDFTLIIFSNASREFLDVKMDVEGLKDYFTEIFSVTSDFKTVKKGPDLYRKICSRLCIDSSDLIHVGDHKVFDYETPREAGITAYFLDRSGLEKGDFVVHDLQTFAKKLYAEHL